MVPSAESLDDDEVVNDREIGGVRGEKRDAVNVGGGGNRQIDRSPARLPASLGNRGREAAPFPCHGSVDREGIERCLDHAEPLRPAPAFVGIGRSERAEVELGE